MNLKALDKEISETISAAWAQTTKSTRSSQWKIYIEFCADNELNCLPASMTTVARFLMFKARSTKYSTLNNYLSAIISFHRYHGYDIDFRGSYFIKLVMEGLRQRLGDSVKQSESLTPCQLIEMSKFVRFHVQREFMLWGAIVLSFRSLLRKSNILQDSASMCSDHVIRRKDVEWTNYGCCLHVNSTKTLKYKDRVLDIPLQTLQDSPLCAVHYIRSSIDMYAGSPDDPIFICNGRPLLYKEGLDFIKSLVKKIGLDQKKVGFHSLRRSGARFLNEIGIPIADIKTVGDWRSLAVLTYLVSPLDRKVEIEHLSVKALDQLSK